MAWIICRTISLFINDLQTTACMYIVGKIYQFLAGRSPSIKYSNKTALQLYWTTRGYEWRCCCCQTKSTFLFECQSFAYNLHIICIIISSSNLLFKNKYYSNSAWINYVNYYRFGLIMSAEDRVEWIKAVRRSTLTSSRRKTTTGQLDCLARAERHPSCGNQWLRFRVVHTNQGTPPLSVLTADGFLKFFSDKVESVRGATMGRPLPRILPTAVTSLSHFRACTEDEVRELSYHALTMKVM